MTTMSADLVLAVSDAWGAASDLRDDVTLRAEKATTGKLVSLELELRALWRTLVEQADISPARAQLVSTQLSNTRDGCGEILWPVRERVERALEIAQQLAIQRW